MGFSRSTAVVPLLLAAMSAAAQEAPRDDGFQRTASPFFAAHCAKCHGPEKAKGKLNLKEIDPNIPAGKDIERWKLIVERLTLNEMPPESEPRPPAADTARFLAWVKSELAKGGVDASDADRKLRLPGHGNRVDHAALFSGECPGPAASPARVWRMSPQIYTALLPRISGDKSSGKSNRIGQPFSTSAAEGFKDYSGLFVVDEPTINQLLRNAQVIVEIQTTPAPRGKPVKEFMALVGAEPPLPPEAVRTALRREFQMGLFRDPTPEESDRFAALLERNVRDAGVLVGIRATLAAILMLPEATYRMELGAGPPDAHGRRMLGPRELAYAVAFALTDDPPDSALLKAAETGKLATRDDVRRELERLWGDRKTAKTRIMRFFEEYFEFTAAMDVFKDLPRGQWRPEILVNDTRRLIQHVLDQDRDVLKELLTTNRSFVNYATDPQKGTARQAHVANKPEAPPKDEKEAEKRRKNPKPRQMEYSDLYNLPPDWKWTPEQPIELPKEQRAGILTQPSWLASFATNNENHAIRRGKWIRERLLGGVVPDLPITVDAQLPDTPEKTLRERMEVNKKEYCWQCHQKMNPLGLAFESYDYLGRFRTTETVVDPTVPPTKPKANEPPVYKHREAPLDSTGLVEHSGDPKLDGPVAGALEMIRKLADSPRVRQVFVRHAFRYWMGRNETPADSPTLMAADRAYVESGGSMKALVLSLLISDSFLYRMDPQPLLRPSTPKSGG
jgi:mono/diheme cytochrome c family protein